ncbi:hypothetical protein HDE68_003861 [Pedobacter cryoconitis]|uniref:Uncharacterized protein n=1 Tax=Pedobacter cryoconitis TaxID=188932 RepID=A0A7W8ZPQ7_9SPHI|nr:hypothetical protein [Pedobacter cryoconitis]
MDLETSLRLLLILLLLIPQNVSAGKHYDEPVKTFRVFK